MISGEFCAKLTDGGVGKVPQDRKPAGSLFPRERRLTDITKHRGYRVTCVTEDYINPQLYTIGGMFPNRTKILESEK